MAVIVMCSVVLAVHGIEQARSGIGWTGVPIGEDGRIQYVGIFNDPNDLGLLFVAALPMSVLLSRAWRLFRPPVLARLQRACCSTACT